MTEDRIQNAFDAIHDEAVRLHDLTEDTELRKGLRAIITMSRFQADLRESEEERRE